MLFNGYLLDKINGCILPSSETFWTHLKIIMIVIVITIILIKGEMMSSIAILRARFSQSSQQHRIFCSQVFARAMELDDFDHSAPQPSFDHRPSHEDSFVSRGVSPNSALNFANSPVTPHLATPNVCILKPGNYISQF